MLGFLFGLFLLFFICCILKLTRTQMCNLMDVCQVIRQDRTDYMLIKHKKNPQAVPGA